MWKNDLNGKAKEKENDIEAYTTVSIGDIKRSEF